jgi:hypothetical protein
MNDGFTLLLSTTVGNIKSNTNTTQALDTGIIMMGFG